VAASSFERETSYPMLEDQTRPESGIDRKPPQNVEGTDGSDTGSAIEPRVRVSAEAGNAKVTVQLATAKKEDLSLNCTEDSVTLSVRTPTGPWIKEIPLPFRVDPDTAKAVFRNGKLELIVRKHGKFNPPGPRIDWV